MGSLVCQKVSGVSGSYKLAAMKPTGRGQLLRGPRRAGAVKKAEKREKSAERKQPLQSSKRKRFMVGKKT